MTAEILWALVLQGCWWGLALCVGSLVLRWWRCSSLDTLEWWVFSFASGTGVISYGIFALGMMGLFNKYAMMIWLVLLALLSMREGRRLFRDAHTFWRQFREHLASSGALPMAVFAAGAGIFAFSALQALTPPLFYDALMYHLQAPVIFLRAGRILPLPHIWQANGPFTIEMSFSIGMAFGNDIFPKLVHVTYAFMLWIATWVAARKFFNARVAWFSVAVLLSIPAFPIWAAGAWVDIGEALYEFLAFYAFLVWARERKVAWLLLSAGNIGLAMGTKYLALGAFGILGLGVLWGSFKNAYRSLVQNVLFFGGVATAIAAPWYVKNWVWLGNPVFPFWFGGGGWPDIRTTLLTTYLHSFGLHATWLDWLLMPVNLYRYADKFATMGLELPGLLFPAVVLLAFVPRDAVLKPIGLLTLARIGVWALGGSLQTRFLLPVFPLVSMLAGFALWAWVQQDRSRMSRKILVTASVGGTLFASLALMGMVVISNRSYAPALGLESRESFVRRMVADYSAHHFINQELPEGSRVFQLWDGRGYYCLDKCLPDTTQSQWTELTYMQGFDPASVAMALEEQGITHLLFSFKDRNYFLLHDPLGLHAQANAFYWREFRPKCLDDVYRDPAVIISRITCVQKGN